MGCHHAGHRRSGLPAAAMAAVLAVTACSPGSGGTAGTAATPAVPVTAEINQLRDNYSKQIVSIQLTNNSGGVVTVLGATLDSALFTAGISWQGPTDGVEIPPGQTKSLPAQLPPPVCGAAAGSADDAATVSLVLATAQPASATAATAATPLATAPAVDLAAADPYGVLRRNNAEMCLAQAASAVAGFRLDPGLEVSADGRTAVVRLLITPQPAGPVAEPASLMIDRIDGTTLLAEDPAVPWPRAVPVRAGGAVQELRLGIRPARCDPHAVAEDKVGTLLPLRVTAGGVEGVLTVAGLDRKGKASVDSSSQGISIGVAAPAENLVGGMPAGGYAEWAGTSGATPIVAGVAALIRSEWPDMPASQVINRIVSTAKDAGAPGKDPLYGFGVLNAEAALKADVPETKVNPLGSISDWIRVHRRGNLATTPAAAAPTPSSAAPTLPEATVPVAEQPSQLDSAVPAVVVLGFGGLFLCIIGAAVFQIRRAVRPAPAANQGSPDSAGGPGEPDKPGNSEKPEGPGSPGGPETGALKRADSGGKS